MRPKPFASDALERELKAQLFEAEEAVQDPIVFLDEVRVDREIAGSGC